MSVSMVVNVTPLALQTVRKTCVTYRMDRVLTVIRDGLEHTVIQDVEREGMVKIAMTNAQDIVEIGILVIT